MQQLLTEYASYGQHSYRTRCPLAMGYFQSKTLNTFVDTLLEGTCQLTSIPLDLVSPRHWANATPPLRRLTMAQRHSIYTANIVSIRLLRCIHTIRYGIENKFM